MDGMVGLVFVCLFVLLVGFWIERGKAHSRSEMIAPLGGIALAVAVRQAADEAGGSVAGQMTGCVFLCFEAAEGGAVV